MDAGEQLVGDTSNGNVRRANEIYGGSASRRRGVEVLSGFVLIEQRWQCANATKTMMGVELEGALGAPPKECTCTVRRGCTWHQAHPPRLPLHWGICKVGRNSNRYQAAVREGRPGVPALFLPIWSFGRLPLKHRVLRHVSMARCR